MKKQISTLSFKTRFLALLLAVICVLTPAFSLNANETSESGPADGIGVGGIYYLQIPLEQM